MPIHVAAVYTSDGVHFLTAAASSEELMKQLAAYVEQQICWLLHDGDAAMVRRLLAAGALAEGVSHYFDRVGHRWEKESLRLEVVGTSA